MASDTGSRLISRVHVGGNALRALRDEWQRLEALSPTAVLFQSLSWCSTVAGRMEDADLADIRIFTVSQDGALVALLPMRLLRKTGRVVLTGLAEPFQEFTDMLLDPQVNAELAYGFLHADMLQEKADYIHLGQVRGDSALARGLADRVPVAGEVDAAPYVQLSDFKDHAEYLPTVRAKTRKNMRNMKNVMERTAPVTHVITQNTEETSALVERTYENRAAWLEERGLNSSSFDDEMFLYILRDLAKLGDETFRSIGMTLKHGETIIAEMWGFIHNERYYAYMSSWNAEYATKGPGRMHLGTVVETAFGEGVKSAEFMIPVVPYKQTWATNEVQVNDHLLAMTFTGHLYVKAWVDFARPQIKSLAYKMPAPMRRGIWAVVNRLRGKQDD